MTGYSWFLGAFMYLFLACFHVSQIQAEPAKIQTVEQVYPGLANGVLKSAKMVKMEGGILLRAGGLEIQESLIRGLVDATDPKLRQQLEKNLFFLLEQEATKKVLVKEARSAGIATDGLTDAQAVKTHLNRMVEGTTVSEEEVKAFYDENKDMVGGMSFEQVKESIRGYLLQQKKLHTVDAYIRNLGDRADIRVNIDWVKAQYVHAQDNPVDRARMSGKPTMVEFGATGCIPCDMMQPILDKLRKNHSDRLNVVFVHVRENQVLGARFGIRSIPVQVFFDKNGQEVFRHVGFYPEVEVLKQLAKLGVK